jgi:hypothetical protein
MLVKLDGEKVVVTMQRDDAKLLINYILLDKGSYTRAYDVADRMQTMLGIMEMAEAKEIQRLAEENMQRSEELVSSSA